MMTAPRSDLADYWRDGPVTPGEMEGVEHTARIYHRFVCGVCGADLDVNARCPNGH